MNRQEQLYDQVDELEKEVFEETKRRITDILGTREDRFNERLSALQRINFSEALGASRNCLSQCGDHSVITRRPRVCSFSFRSAPRRAMWQSKVQANRLRPSPFLPNHQRTFQKLPEFGELNRPD